MPYELFVVICPLAGIAMWLATLILAERMTSKLVYLINAILILLGTASFVFGAYCLNTFLRI